MATRKKKKDTRRQDEEIFGILLMTLGVLVLLSLITYDPSEEPSGLRLIAVKNAMGVVGVYISFYLIKMFIGYPAVVVPFLLMAWGWNRFRGNDPSGLARATLFALVLALYIATILGLPQAAAPGEFPYGFEFSGLVGGFIATKLYTYFGSVGSMVILIAIALVAVIAITRVSIDSMISSVLAGIAAVLNWSVEQVKRFKKPKIPRHAAVKKQRMGSRIFSGSKKTGQQSTQQADLFDQEQRPSHELPLEQRPPRMPDLQPPSQRPQPAEPDLAPSSSPELGRQGDSQVTVHERDDLNQELSEDDAALAPSRDAYVFPALDLLHRPETTVAPISRDELLSNAKILEERLDDFGIDGQVVEINPGPVITRYEFEPAPGVKVSKITALSDDLALAMRARRIRIIAPIPGKAAVGIELPNRDPQTVYFRSIVDTDQFRDSDSPLTMALGKTISGKTYITQLEKMPHLLVAGSTGSGKSVCLNAILASILYKAHPTEVQIVLIDPKRLELSHYSALHKHHLTYREDLDEVVVTNPANALAVLRSLEYEMERRYDRLALSGARNIAEFNRKVEQGKIQPADDEPVRKLPHIVVVIDELADLMLTAAKEVEEPISRLTQMARAVGMHLIVATQRPSVDVITGVIKANFPARIAFAVASKTDSRTILDMNGAEKLLGKGDMLFLPPSSPEAIRLHGAFISTEEIEGILAHIQQQPRYPKTLLPVREEETITSVGGGTVSGKRDVLFNEALKLVVRHQQGSISLLQRRLKVGYARAARLIDELEAAGIVGAFDGSKAREVLIDEEQLEHLDPDSL